MIIICMYFAPRSDIRHAIVKSQRQEYGPLRFHVCLSLSPQTINFALLRISTVFVHNVYPVVVDYSVRSRTI